VPNRNSRGEIIEKKRKASNATEATMPMVVNTAIVEQPMSSHSMTRSTRLRARSSGVMRERIAITAPTAMTITSTVSDMRLMPRSRRYSAEAACTASLTVEAGTLPATRLRTSFIHERKIVLRKRAHALGQMLRHQAKDDRVLNVSQRPMIASAGSAHHIAVINP
jgi:hypothetical protein